MKRFGRTNQAQATRRRKTKPTHKMNDPEKRTEDTQQAGCLPRPCSPGRCAPAAEPLPELTALDEDLRQWYLADADARYVPGVPIKIQIVRLLRELLQQGNHCKDSSDYSEGPQDNVEPEKLVGKSAGSAFVPVNGIRKLLGDCAACYAAVWTVHAPGGPTDACEAHADKLQRLMQFMGAHTTKTPAPEGAQCANCVNRAKRHNAEVCQPEGGKKS